MGKRHDEELVSHIGEIIKTLKAKPERTKEENLRLHMLTNILTGDSGVPKRIGSI